MPIDTMQAAGMAHTPMVNAIVRGVQSGELSPGDRLPSEVQLSRRYRISVTSVRKGVRELAQQGMVLRRRGSGTYVSGEAAGAGRSERHEMPTRPTERQTVAMILPLSLAGYHPFFSEQLAGIRLGLADHGWKLWDFDYEHQHQSYRDVGAVEVKVPDLVARLRAERGLAGAIVGATLAAQLVNELPGLPIVAANTWPDLPNVDYDWEDEARRGLRHLAAQGCTRIWTSGRQALDVELPGLHIEHCPVPNSNLLSELTSNTFRAFQQAWQEGPSFDGVLARNEFEAQGIVDAAVKLDLRIPADFRMLAMFSRKSHLRSPFPIARLLADGELKGRELARLLHERLTRPESAPRAIVLAGTLETY